MSYCGDEDDDGCRCADVGHREVQTYDGCVCSCHCHDEYQGALETEVEDLRAELARAETDIDTILEALKPRQYPETTD